MLKSRTCMQLVMRDHASCSRLLLRIMRVANQWDNCQLSMRCSAMSAPCVLPCGQNRFRLPPLGTTVATRGYPIECRRRASNPSTDPE